MQQVNLYTQELRPNKVILPLSQMVAGFSLLLILLIAYSVYYRIQVVELETNVLAKQKSVEQVQQQVAGMETQLKGMQKDESLISGNRKLNQQMVARKQLLSMLDSVVMANRYPFSNLMIGLARHKVDNLWLTQIQFANGGEKVGLKGKATQADAVPHYLQTLREETLLLGRSFDLFQLSTDEEHEEILHFTLSSSLMTLGATNE